MQLLIVKYVVIPNSILIITPDIGDKNVTRNPRRLTSKNIQIQKTVMSKSITALLTLIAACSISTVQAQVNAADSVMNHVKGNITVR